MKRCCTLKALRSEGRGRRAKRVAKLPVHYRLVTAATIRANGGRNILDWMRFLENLPFSLPVWIQKETFEVQDALVSMKGRENLSATILLTHPPPPFILWKQNLIMSVRSCCLKGFSIWSVLCSSYLSCGWEHLVSVSYTLSLNRRSLRGRKNGCKFYRLHDMCPSKTFLFLVM